MILTIECTPTSTFLGIDKMTMKYRGVTLAACQFPLVLHIDWFFCRVLAKLLAFVCGLVRCWIVPIPRSGWSPRTGWSSRGIFGPLPLQSLATIIAGYYVQTSTFLE